MNNLNSVLIEGEIVDDSCILIYDDHLGDCTQFGIKCTQTFGKVKNKYIFMDVLMQKPLATKVTEYIKENHTVRLVGRLWTDETRTLVLADHIEFKPIMPKSGV